MKKSRRNRPLFRRQIMKLKPLRVAMLSGLPGHDAPGERRLVLKIAAMPGKTIRATAAGKV